MIMATGATALLFLACVGVGATTLRVIGVLEGLRRGERLPWSFALGIGLLGWITFFPAAFGLIAPLHLAILCLACASGLYFLFCAGFMAGVGLFLMGSVDSLPGLVGAYLNDAFGFMAPAMNSADLTGMVDMLVTMFPGAMGASWVLMLVVNALLAQSVLVRMGNNIRPSPRFTNLALPQWLAWPMVIMAAIGLLASGDIRYIAQNTAIVLAVPYFFLGLSVIHWAVRRLTFATPLLVGLYLVLLISGWALLFVAALGMAEQWTGLRKRFSTNDHDQTTI